MHVGQVEVQVPHMGEWVIHCRTASDPTIIRTLVIRIIRTIWLVFCPTLLDPICLTTVRAHETLIQLRCISTMLGLPVLLHPLRASILLTTVWTCHLLTPNTSQCVSFPHFLVSQDLTIFSIRVLFAPVHPHVHHQLVVCLKGLLTHRTVLGFPWDRRNLVRDLCNLPGLGVLWKVLPMKKG